MNGRPCAGSARLSRGVVPWHSAAVPNLIHVAAAREALCALALAATLLARAQAGTSAEFALAFTIDANRRLTITLHEVYLALAKRPIEGPAGVEASFDFRTAFNATATRMMSAVLRNQQAGSEYA